MSQQNTVSDRLADIDRIARNAAREASIVLKSNYGRVSPSDIEQKAKNDFVSFVDREAEQAIINVVRREFPEHAFLTEEGQADSQIKNKYRWIVDPLDGTTNYLRMHHRFSVSIGVEENGSLVYGLVLDVLQDEWFTAGVNCGAFLNGKKIHVSEVEKIDEALVLFGTPFRQPVRIVNAYSELFGKMQNSVSDHRREGSAALDLASVAAGRAEAFYELALKPWDVAAGQLLVKEAGGWVGDFYGANDDLFRTTFLATSGKLKDSLLSILSGWQN